MKKRFLIGVIFFVLLALNAADAAVALEGDRTSETPYQIQTVDDLFGFEEHYRTVSSGNNPHYILNSFLKMPLLTEERPGFSAGQVSIPSFKIALFPETSQAPEPRAAWSDGPAAATTH